MIQRLLEKLAGQRGALLTAGIAVLLSLPALRNGYQADDHILAYQLLHRGQPPWSLFHLTQQTVAEGVELGALAWWSSPQLDGAFLRPLSSLIPAAMISLWPSLPWLMLLVNVLVYGAAVWLAADLYRRLSLSPAHAALAGLMFAIDDAHAHSIGWISGGNTVLALLGSLAALWCHARAVESGSYRFTLGSALATAFALAAGEAGTWTFCFLLAHALVLDARPLAVRLRSLAPQLAVAALWAAVYVHGHYGIHHSSWYQELSSPVATLIHGVSNLPLSITSLLGPSLIGFSIFEPLWISRLILLPVALLLLWLVWPALWSSKPGRFFALVGALGILPAFLTVPQDRVLMGASFGAFGFIAIAWVDSDALSTIRHRVARVVLRGCHIWMAAVLFIPMLAAQYRFELGTQALLRVAEPGRIAVLINAPMELLANYAMAVRNLDPDKRGPRALHQLYAGASELFVERTGERVLEVTATRGWGYVALERIFCAEPEMPKAGDERRVHGVTVRVLASNAAGMPERVRFTFDVALESAELDWLLWTNSGEAVPFQPPALGQSVRIEPLNLIDALPQG